MAHEHTSERRETDYFRNSFDANTILSIILNKTLSVNNAPIIISCNECFIIQCFKCNGRTHLKKKRHTEFKSKRESSKKRSEKNERKTKRKHSFKNDIKWNSTDRVAGGPFHPRNGTPVTKLKLIVDDIFRTDIINKCNAISFSLCIVTF